MTGHDWTLDGPEGAIFEGPDGVCVRYNGWRHAMKMPPHAQPPTAEEAMDGLAIWAEERHGVDIRAFPIIRRA